MSRSTFFRYFGSKEAVLLNEMDTSGDVFLKSLRGRPAAETPLKAFEEALLATFRDADERRTPDEQRAIDDLLRNDPALSGRRLEELTRWTGWIAETFAARARRSEPALEDRIAAATCMAIGEEVGRVWREDTGVDPTVLIPEAFAIARSL